MVKTILFALLIPSILSGQGTMLVANGNKEIYSVLNTDHTVRQGSYRKLDNSDKYVKIEGYYRNNIKDSLWSVYDDKGVLEQVFDYTHNQLVYCRLDANIMKREYKVIGKDSTFETLLERPPVYIGGQSLILDRILLDLKYPDQAAQNNISGDVIVSFVIDTTGKAIDHKVINGIGYGCDEEALRVVKAIPDAWVTALLNGKPTKVEITLAINFGVQVISLTGH